MTHQQRLRNIGISAHIDAGKTTLAERMLFYCGRIHTMGDVHSACGGATMDSDPIERKRGITISSAATSVDWSDHVLNIIDTPGHVDFTIEVERSLRVLDGAILVLCGVAGVQSQSNTVDRQMRKHGVPRIAVINKMDRIGANPSCVIDQLDRRLAANPIALQIPIGTEKDFRGVVDLIEMESIYFDGELGQHVRRESVPTELRADAEHARMTMIETLAMANDSLLELVARDVEPTSQQLHKAIRESTVSRAITPVLYCSAYKNVGVQTVLDAVVKYLPSPEDRRVIIPGTRDCLVDAPGDVLASDPEQPMAALAFKTVVEKFGQLTYMRLYRGTLKRGKSYRNARTGKLVRMSRIVKLHADKREDIDFATAGEIVGVMGIQCVSGDTFHDAEAPVVLEQIEVMEPVLQRSIRPVRRQDSDKLAKALERFRRDDPTFHVSTDPSTGETLIAGMGELHLEVYTQRLREQYECKCEVGKPSVAYKQRPTRCVDFEYKLKKMTGGPGTFALIRGRMEPLPDDCEDRFQFEDLTRGGCIERRFIPAIEAGFREALESGPLGNHEVFGLRIQLTDGQQHEQDSSEIAFHRCAVEAMRKSILPRAAMVLMEPVMALELEVPQDHQGVVAGLVAGNRGVVTSSNVQRSQCKFTAEAPLAELFSFANQLRSLTQGEGTFSMQPLNYQRAPS